jgi:hypothetical protein
MNRLLIIIFCLTLFACDEASPTLSTKELAFKKFVSKQRLIDLPLYFDLENFSDEISLGYIIESSDTLYIPDDSLFIPADTLFIPTDVVPGRVWGIYKDTSEFFLVVTLGAWGYPLPELILFDKHGNKIGKERLMNGDCNIVDYGRTCNWTAKVYKDINSSNIKFYAQDSVLHLHYDSLKKEIAESRQHYIKFKSGSIDNSGHITVKTGSLSLLK